MDAAGVLVLLTERAKRRYHLKVRAYERGLREHYPRRGVIKHFSAVGPIKVKATPKQSRLPDIHFRITARLNGKVTAMKKIADLLSQAKATEAS